jgi:two-component system, OmpR family, sensor kinase
MTIRNKLSIAYTIAFGVILIGFALLVYRSSSANEQATLDAHLEGLAERLQSEIEEQWDEGMFPAAGDLSAVRAEGLTDPRFQITDTAGVVVLSQGIPPPLSPENLARVRRGSPVREDITLGTRTYRTLTSPVEAGGTTVAILQLAASTAPAEANLSRLRFLFLVSIPATLLLALGVAYVLTQRAFSPITSMIGTAQKISADNLDARLHLPGVHDEIHQLGETLNSMMGRISDAFDRQRQFVADASHEIHTPLTVICSELEFVQQRTTDAQAGESIRLALSEVDRLSKMTREMLTLARMDSASRFPLDCQVVRLDELLVESVQILKSLIAQKRLLLELHIGEVVEIKADRDGLKSALMNLLDNAVKYSPQGGTVSVALSVLGPSRVRIEVKDTGPGIAATDLPHIFKRFYRPAAVRAGTPGSGLGLAIVEHVVKAHNGTVTVQSSAERGSVFVVELPLA